MRRNFIPGHVWFAVTGFRTWTTENLGNLGVRSKVEQFRTSWNGTAGLTGLVDYSSDVSFAGPLAEMTLKPGSTSLSGSGIIVALASSTANTRNGLVARARLAHVLSTEMVHDTHTALRSNGPRLATALGCPLVAEAKHAKGIRWKW